MSQDSKRRKVEGPTKNVGCVIYRKSSKGGAVCDLTVEPLPIPSPRAGEVLIQIKSVGICGSDVHYWQHGNIGSFVVGERLVLGHECSGIVHALGEGVTDLKVGDRIAMEPGIACGLCNYCKTGRYNLCPKMAFWATPPYHGSLCNYVAHPAAYCFKLPDNVSFDDGAMLEPFSVGVYSCRRAGVQVGTSVLITGAGPIGLTAILAALAYGATDVTVADIDAARLKVAKECGASATVLVKDTPDYKLVDHLPTKADVTLECTGSEACTAAAIEATKPGGKVVLIGCGPDKITVPLVSALSREVDILGNFRYCNTWPTAIAMVASGKVNFKPLVTHHFDFGDLETVKTAFQTSLDRKDKSGKPAIKVMFRL